MQMQHPNSHIYVISAASLTVRWHSYSCSMFDVKTLSLSWFWLMFKRKCNIPIPTFMSSLLQVSQSGDILVAAQCSMSRHCLFPDFDWCSTGNAASKFRDCLFPGGDEGAGGVLVAEEAFYQVSQSWCPVPPLWTDLGPDPVPSLFWRDELVSWVFIVCILFPVSSGSWVPESGAARVKRECWGWKSSTPHGFLHLLRFDFHLYIQCLQSSLSQDGGANLRHHIGEKIQMTLKMWIGKPQLLPKTFKI